MLKAFVNCRIFDSEDTAFAIDGDRIVRTGSDEDIRAFAQEDVITDLDGMFVVPGFIDTHMHMLGLGYTLTNADLTGCRSAADVIRVLQAHCETLKEGEWLIGRGYNEDHFDDGSVLTKELIDTYFPDRPAALKRVCGHVMTVNSRTLELAGIREDTECDGGRILFDTGRVEENGIALIQEIQPKPDAEAIRGYLHKAMAFCNSKGITCAASDDFISITGDQPLVLDTYEKMSFRSDMTVRINQQCEFTDIDQFAAFLDDGYTMDVGNDLFRIGPLKLITDGSLGARTAAMSRPYHDMPSEQGYMCMDEDEIRMYTKLANKFNMATICHAIGDEAVDKVLAVFKDEVLEGNPLHHGLVHCQIMRPSQIAQVLKQHLSCYIQTLFIDYDSSILKDRAGSLLARSSYPFRTLYEGTLTSNGSDAPVETPDPIRGIQLAVTRRSFDGKHEMEQSECLSVDQAIRSYTCRGAEQLFMEDRLGCIREGYYADFAVIDRDIRECEPQDISKASVVCTYMNGEKVFEK